MSAKRIVRLKSRLKLSYQRVIRNTSITSLIFEWIINYYGRKIENKGFLLKLSLIGHSQFESHKSSPSEEVLGTYGFVFQGGFETLGQVNYFLETIEMLRSRSPKSPVVLSTFPIPLEFTNQILSSSIRFTFDVIENEDPGTLKRPYAKNLLRQISSTHNGLEHLHQLGVNKVAKVRIDQRIGNLNSIKFIDYLLHEYSTSCNQAQMRIVGSSLNTFASLPVFMSDCLLFGHIKDMRDYWAFQSQETFSESVDQVLGCFGQDVFQLGIHPEIWLAAKYVRSKGLGPKDIWACNEIFWRDLALVVDSSFLDHQWQKQSKYFASNYKSIKWLEGTLESRFREMSFSDWLSKYGARHSPYSSIVEPK